eukprot:XP_001699414.1 predicted protein [Chlamydomonas reinhardtii]
MKLPSPNTLDIGKHKSGSRRRPAERAAEGTGAADGAGGAASGAASRPAAADADADSDSDFEVEVVGEKGQVTTRDFPHPRPDCAVHKFKDNGVASNAQHCANCFCYVCDVKASECAYWGTALSKAAVAAEAMPLWGQSDGSDTPSYYTRTNRVYCPDCICCKCGCPASQCRSWGSAGAQVRASVQCRSWGSAGAQVRASVQCRSWGSAGAQVRAFVQCRSWGSAGAQVANRDFPHPRPDCVSYRFKAGASNGSGGPAADAANWKHCPNCYCYVCDVKASECAYWGTGVRERDHANARNTPFWTRLRREARIGNKPLVKAEWNRHTNRWRLAAAATTSAVNLGRRPNRHNGPTTMCGVMRGRRAADSSSTGWLWLQDECTVGTGVQGKSTKGAVHVCCCAASSGDMRAAELRDGPFRPGPTGEELRSAVQEALMLVEGLRQQQQRLLRRLDESGVPGAPHEPAAVASHANAAAGVPTAQYGSHSADLAEEEESRREQQLYAVCSAFATLAAAAAVDEPEDVMPASASVLRGFSSAATASGASDRFSPAGAGMGPRCASVADVAPIIAAYSCATPVRLRAAAGIFTPVGGRGTYSGADERGVALCGSDDGQEAEEEQYGWLYSSDDEEDACRETVPAEANRGLDLSVLRISGLTASSIITTSSDPHRTGAAHRRAWQ